MNRLSTAVASSLSGKLCHQGIMYFGCAVARPAVAAVAAVDAASHQVRSITVKVARGHVELVASFCTRCFLRCWSFFALWSLPVSPRQASAFGETHCSPHQLELADVCLLLLSERVKELLRCHLTRYQNTRSRQAIVSAAPWAHNKNEATFALVLSRKFSCGLHPAADAAPTWSQAGSVSMGACRWISPRARLAIAPLLWRHPADTDGRAGRALCVSQSVYNTHIQRRCARGSRQARVGP